MVTLGQATKLAEEHVSSLAAVSGIPMTILPEATQEEDVCYIFFYDIERSEISGKEDDFLVGNAPLLVARDSGNLFVLGTALPVERYIQAFREYGNPHDGVPATGVPATGPPSPGG
jgi:hypothetical protein